MTHQRPDLSGPGRGVDRSIDYMHTHHTSDRPRGQAAPRPSPHLPVDDYISIDALEDLGLDPAEVLDRPGVVLLTGHDGKPCFRVEDLDGEAAP